MRDVAIKMLPPSFASDPERLRRFEQEAQAAGRLSHPNVTAVYDETLAQEPRFHELNARLRVKRDEYRLLYEGAEGCAVSPPGV